MPKLCYQFGITSYFVVLVLLVAAVFSGRSLGKQDRTPSPQKSVRSAKALMYQNVPDRPCPYEHVPWQQELNLSEGLSGISDRVILERHAVASLCITPAYAYYILSYYAYCTLATVGKSTVHQEASMTISDFEACAHSVCAYLIT